MENVDESSILKPGNLKSKNQKLLLIRRIFRAENQAKLQRGASKSNRTKTLWNHVKANMFIKFLRRSELFDLRRQVSDFFYFCCAMQKVYTFNCNR